MGRGEQQRTGYLKTTYFPSSPCTPEHTQHANMARRKHRPECPCDAVDNMCCRVILWWSEQHSLCIQSMIFPQPERSQMWCKVEDVYTRENSQCLWWCSSSSSTCICQQRLCGAWNDVASLNSYSESDENSEKSLITFHPTHHPSSFVLL